jgi:hypothetical protein
MKRVILAIGYAAALTVTGGSVTAQAQAQWAYSRPNAERSPPPTEPSIALPAVPAVNVPKVDPPKPVVRNVIVRRPHSIQSGPVNMPAPDVLVMMVRAALTAVNQANFTENYSVLRGMTTPALQARLSAEKLGQAFVGLRKQNLDLSPALVLAPDFTEAPKLTSAGGLMLKGIFPTRPLRINFAIDYLPIDGFWMIDQMSVSASRADAPLVAVAAEPPAAAAPAPAPVTQNAVPPSNANADAAPSALSTARFVPVNYSVDYKPAFQPIVRQANAKPRAMPAAAAARQGPVAYLQVTSQRSEAEAKAAFNSLRARFPAILGDRQPVIRRADLGDKGIYYRAQIGPVNPAEADRQCGALKAVGGQCFVQYN